MSSIRERMALPLTFLEGKARAAFGSLADAVRACEIARDDDGLRRAVWFCPGARADGWVVPDLWLAGLYPTANPPAVTTAAVIEGKDRVREARR